MIEQEPDLVINIRIVEPSPTNETALFFHCTQCIKEMPEGESPRSWARLEVGHTASHGIQVWCVRHERNVVHLEYEITEESDET